VHGWTAVSASYEGAKINGIVSVIGTFVMEGGAIAGNTASGYGGGVFVNHSDTNRYSTGFTKKSGAMIYGDTNTTHSAGSTENTATSDYGYAVYMGIMPPGGATLEQVASDKHYLMKPPVDGKGLRRLRFTRRKKEKILFGAEDAGMTAYICCRCENAKGEAGQWGPVASAIIP
jgi:hypothetical protein